MNKRQLARQIAEASTLSNNHFVVLRLKIEAIAQYLMELPDGEAQGLLLGAPETEEHPMEEVPPEEPQDEPYEEPPPEEEPEPVVEEEPRDFGPPGESELPPSYVAP